MVQETTDAGHEEMGARRFWIEAADARLEVLVTKYVDMGVPDLNPVPKYVVATERPGDMTLLGCTTALMNHLLACNQA